MLYALFFCALCALVPRRGHAIELTLIEASGAANGEIIVVGSFCSTTSAALFNNTERKLYLLAGPTPHVPFDTPVELWTCLQRKRCAQLRPGLLITRHALCDPTMTGSRSLLPSPTRSLTTSTATGKRSS